MKISIFALLVLISINYIIAQNKCDENPVYSESEIIKLPPDSKKGVGAEGKFYFDDAIVICTKINGNTYLIQILDNHFKLKAEKQLKFNKKKKWAHIEDVLKKDDEFYFYIKGKGKKKHLYSEKKYDFNLNLISDKIILETSDHNFNNLAAHENIMGLRFYNNKSNFKITSLIKKEVFVHVFDENLNKINEYSYLDKYNTLRRPIILNASFTSNDGSLFTIYDQPMRENGKTVNKLTARKISIDGKITTNNSTFTGVMSYEGHFVKSSETSEEFTLVFTYKKKYLDNTIKGISVITYNKSDLSIISSEFIPIKIP